jgi:hypothetical protein
MLANCLNWFNPSIAHQLICRSEPLPSSTNQAACNKRAIALGCHTLRGDCTHDRHHRTNQSVPEVVPPVGATTNDPWQAVDPQPYRVVTGHDRKVTDHKLCVSTRAVQWADGSIDDGAIEPPLVYVFELGENAPLNSDQAWELTSVLSQAAAEVEGWAR